MMRFHLLGMGAGIAVALFCGNLWGQGPAEPLEVGARAPDFAGSDQYHRPFKSWQKRVLGGLVLAFFQPRDEDSEDLLHYLQKRGPAYERIGLPVVAVEVRSQPEQVAYRVQDPSLDFPVVLDLDRRIQRAYRVGEQDVPLVFVIKRDGTIAGRIASGSRISTDRLEASLEQVRAELARPGAQRASAVPHVVRIPSSLNAPTPNAPTPEKEAAPVLPRGPHPQLLAAQWKYEQGDTPGAIREASEAVQSNDQDARAHLYLGYLLEVAGDYAGALRSYEQATSLNPRSGYAHAAVARLQPFAPLISLTTRPSVGGTGGLERTGETGETGGTQAAKPGEARQERPRAAVKRQDGQHWLAVGPFGTPPTQAGDGTVFYREFLAPFPPEEEVVDRKPLAKGYPGTFGLVRWEEIDPQGPTLDLHDRPEIDGGVVYALTYIYSDEGREVFVKLAAWGSVALWWNRYMIYAYDMARHPDPTDPTGQRKQHLGADTPPLAAHLDAGWNLILIKNRYEYGDGWRVEWDILDMEGSPLPNLWYSTEPVE